MPKIQLAIFDDNGNPLSPSEGFRLIQKSLGLTCREMADYLGVSERTVNYHREKGKISQPIMETLNSLLGNPPDPQPRKHSSQTHLSGSQRKALYDLIDLPESQGVSHTELARIYTQRTGRIVTRLTVSLYRKIEVSQRNVSENDHNLRDVQKLTLMNICRFHDPDFDYLVIQDEFHRQSGRTIGESALRRFLKANFRDSWESQRSRERKRRDPSPEEISESLKEFWRQRENSK